ncbi:MAG: hypothetical protein WD552_02565, partial [Candidatus Paceibacterota bacterium]
MKKLTTAITFLVSLAFPAMASAVTYAEDGAVLLGDAVQSSGGSGGNVAAALVGADFSLTCLGLAVLALITIYLLHELWHPKRLHQQMTAEELRAGTMRFYIGGTIVWLLIAIMAEKLCVILP